MNVPFLIIILVVMSLNTVAQWLGICALIHHKKELVNLINKVRAKRTQGVAVKTEAKDS